MNNVFISRYWYTPSNFCESTWLIVWSIHLFVSIFMDSSYQLTENQKVLLHFIWIWLLFHQDSFLKFSTKMTKLIRACGHCTSFVTLHHATTCIRRNKGCSSGVFWWVLSGLWVKISKGLIMYSTDCLVSLIISVCKGALPYEVTYGNIETKQPSMPCSEKHSELS